MDSAQCTVLSIRFLKSQLGDVSSPGERSKKFPCGHTKTLKWQCDPFKMESVCVDVVATHTA